MIPLGLFIALCIAYLAGWVSACVYRDRVESDRARMRDACARRADA